VSVPGVRATSWPEPPVFPLLPPVLEGQVGGVDGVEPLGGPAVVGVRLQGLLAVGGLQLVGGGAGREPQEVEGVGGPEDFARLALGLFANSTSAYPLTFGYAAQAAAPQGTADVLDVRGEGNFALRLFIHSETRLPIMVSWQAPPTSVVVTTPGQPPPATIAPGAVVITAPAAPPASAPQEQKDAYTKDVAALRQKAQTTPVEYRLYYADYRDVDGVKLPFRLRRAIGPDTTEETTFDRFRLNTKIDPRKFAQTK